LINEYLPAVTQFWNPTGHGHEDMSAVVTAIRGADRARAWRRTASVHQESAVDQTWCVTRIICPTTIAVVP
jgi:hypothetical protein